MFSVVTTFALSEDRLLGLLVLGHLELFVLVAVRTVGPAGLGDVDLKKKSFFRKLKTPYDRTKEISIQGEGALPLVQLSINFKRGC